MQAAKQALRQVTLADPVAATAALRTVQARLNAGRRALAANDFKRAHTLLTSSSAQEDVEELRRQVTTLQAEQQRLERLREDLKPRRQELQARVKAVNASLAGLRVDTSAVHYQLSDLRARLKAAEGARKRGNLAAAQQTFAVVQTALDTLEGEEIPRLRRDDEERRRLSQRLVQRGAALSTRLQEMRGRLTALAHVNVSSTKAALQALEHAIRAGLAAHRSGDYDRSSQHFDAGEQTLVSLQRHVAELQETDRCLDDLHARLQRRHQDYLSLQARLSLLDDPALAAEQQAVEQAVALLSGLDPTRRLSSADPLEALLAQTEEPDQVKARVAAKLGARAPLQQPAASEEITSHLADLQVGLETLSDTLQDAERQGVLALAEHKSLEEWRTALERAQAACKRGAWQEAWAGLVSLDRRRLAELQEGLERRIALAASLQLKTTLSLARVSDTRKLNRYNVILNISGTGWGDAGSIRGNIKVGHKDRVDLRQAIDDLTTVINLLFGAQGSLRGQQPEIREDTAIDSLAELGDMMYGLFLPVSIQEHLREARTSILLATDDLELPWELLHTGDDFLCLHNPVGRMPIMNRFPRRNSYHRGEPLQFLFIANPTGDLAASEREVERIVARLEGVEATIWKGSEVTNLKLYQALRGGEYDVIHYSGHAFYNRKAPNESGLVLADQHIFIADTIKRMLRGRPLIFLNACESGREMMTDGEVTYTGSDNEGLALSFVLGGALGFIGTLWPIFDEGAAEFAAIFYEHLLSGEMIGEAMRQARLKLRQARPNDVTWASFILYGDPTLTMIEKE